MIESSPTLPFPDFLDSSGLSDFKLCETRFFFSSVLRICPKEPNVHLVAGGAFAAGLEAARRAHFEQGKPVPEAEAIGLYQLLNRYELDTIPEKMEKKSVERVAVAYESYMDKYPLAECPPITLPSGRRGIELSFSLDTGIARPGSDNHESILYCGKIDNVPHTPIGVACQDDKTCSSLESDTSHWELRSQILGYAFALREMGVSPKWIIVRRVALLKEDIKHAEVLVSPATWKLERWLEETQEVIYRITVAYDGRRWSQVLDDACSTYGGCPYRELCRMEKPQEWITSSGFVQKTWNPLVQIELPKPKLLVEDKEQGNGLQRDNAKANGGSHNSGDDPRGLPGVVGPHDLETPQAASGHAPQSA